MKAAGSALQAIGGGFTEIYPIWIQTLGIDAALMYAFIWQTMDAFIGLDDDLAQIRKNKGWMPLHLGWIKEMNIPISWIENQLLVLRHRKRIEFKKSIETKPGKKAADYYIFFLADRLEGLYNKEEGFEDMQVSFYQTPRIICK